MSNRRHHSLSWKDVWWLAVSPLVSAAINPLNLIKTLQACRVLRGGRWADYAAFAFGPAVLRAFYWAEDLSLQRFGRDGISPLLAWGAFPLRHFWYQSMFALAVDACVGGVVTSLIAMTGWIAAHYFWLNDVGAVPLVVLALPLLAVVTNNFYGNVFGWQNYNLFGWAAFPVVVHGLVSADYWGLAVGTLIAGTFSITVVAMAVPMVVIVAIARQEWWAVLALIPALTVVAHRAAGSSGSRMAPGTADLDRLLKAIGTRVGRYRRPRYVWQSLAVALVLGTLPAAMLLRGSHAYQLNSLALATLNLVPIVGLVLAETRVFRWADIHSYLFAFLTVSTGTTMAAGDPVLVGIWWIANSNSAVGRMLFNFTPQASDAWAPAVRPYDVRPVKDAIADLLSVVPSGSRIWLACDDPGHEYNRVFDGYSDVYELAHFCANEREVLLTPDWYAVFQHNVDLSAQTIWGRDPRQASANAQGLGANHILVYERPGEGLAGEYAEHGWQLVRSLDWRRLKDGVGGEPRFEIAWHLFHRSV